MAACRKMLIFLEIFVFFGKTTSYGKKCSTFCSESFHRNADRRIVFKFREIGRHEIGEIVRCLPDQKQNFAWLSCCR